MSSVMNILFLTIGKFVDVETHALYPDLLRCFRDYGHNIYVVSTYERRDKQQTEYIEKNGIGMLHVRIGNITKCNLLEKGLSTLFIEYFFKNAIEKYLSHVHFDLVLYSTPPITFARLVDYISCRDNASTYLLLKDIFPQNAVDIGILSPKGLRGIVYHYFRNKEKQLYHVSNFIGCMSNANVNYLLKHNPWIAQECVEVCPNSIDVSDKSILEAQRVRIREQYNLPLEKVVFVYGGNLGKPQGIDFFIKCLDKIIEIDAFFLIIGNGTEYDKIASFLNNRCPSNIRLMNSLPRDIYEILISACDVGLIFLDYRFTIPNFPSRLLSYMQAHLPVLACTDPNTDVGQVIVQGGFGWWCLSNDVDGFIKKVQDAMQANRRAMGENAWDYLKEHYDVEIAYKTIMSHFEKEQSSDV